MSITVSQVLQLDGLKDSRILAGQRNLENEIEQVNILEAVLESEWDQVWYGYQHQLALTTFNMVKDNIVKQKSIIESLHRGQCSVLVFQPSIIPGLAPEVVEFADQLGLPVIEIPHDLMYPSVISPIIEAILKEKTTLLQRSTDIHRKFMDLILDGDDLNSIASALGELISQPVAIIDSSGNELASSPKKIQPEKLLNVEGLLERVRDTQIKEVSYFEHMGLSFMPLLSGKNSKTDGYIFVDAVICNLNQMDCVAIEQAAVVATYELAKRRAVQEAERAMRRDFIEELLEGDFHSKETYLSRARSIGWDLANKPVMMVIEVKKIHSEERAKSAFEEERLSGAKDRLFRSISQVVLHHSPLHIIIDQSDNILLLPDFEAKTDKSIMRKKINEMAQEILRATKEKFKDFMLYIAVGGIHGAVDRLRISYSEARSALRIGPPLLPAQNVFWYEDLAAYTLFDNEEVRTGAARLAEQLLGRLLEYDRSNHTNLLETLEAYFDNNQNLSTSAARLFIHPKTMKYRLDRIKDILGTDPFAGHKQFQYYLCTKVAKMQLSGGEEQNHSSSNNG